MGTDAGVGILTTRHRVSPPFTKHRHYEKSIIYINNVVDASDRLRTD